MARPKKTKTADLVRITEDYFMYEAHGDASKLKCTLIAKYAKKTGYPSCEHWDFRRDEGVQNRIRQLTELVEKEGLRSCPGDLFRPMDKDKLIRNAKDPEKLRTILEQMEQSWKLVYENSVQLKKEIIPLREENESLKHDKKVIEEENISLDRKSTRLNSSH